MPHQVGRSRCCRCLRRQRVAAGRRLRDRVQGDAGALAPARLSITTGWPVLAVMCASMRAARSVTPPAEVDTISLSVWRGSSGRRRQVASEATTITRRGTQSWESSASVTDCANSNTVGKEGGFARRAHHLDAARRACDGGTARRAHCVSPTSRQAPCPPYEDSSWTTNTPCRADPVLGAYRDQGKWPELTATFAPEGEIAVSWFSGPFREFVALPGELRGRRAPGHLILPRTCGLPASARWPRPTSSSWCARGSARCSPTSPPMHASSIGRAPRRSLDDPRAHGDLRADRPDPVEPSRISPSCSRRQISRSTRRPIAIWLRAWTPPAARWRGGLPRWHCGNRAALCTV